MKQHIKTVKEFNPYKMGSIDGYPLRLSEAMDEVVKAAERYELLRVLTPHEFHLLLRDAQFQSAQYFDDLVDKLIAERK